MDFWFLVAGIAIGLAVAAPIGPVNIICIQKTIRNGFWGAFVVGLGAAVGDTIFGAMAAFGLTTIQSVLVQFESWLAVIGCLVLVGMGVLAWRSHPHLTQSVQTPRDIAHAALATFVLTITNPITALGFVALFTSAGLTRDASSGDAATIVLGVFLGSALWWLFICRVAHSIRERLSDSHLLRINRASAVLIWIFAALVPLKVFLA
ncbi:LysE family translocator [Govanella unica]|uniref:LysE family translocator n=1 Tax=Govanella unica TaxID=2975056 RepID=A0A9X3TXH3_9PROT|nr:LysE family transporter [Govania unica]MDA5193162.1 LysE family translocator [Govania unica]